MCKYFKSFEFFDGGSGSAFSGVSCCGDCEGISTGCGFQRSYDDLTHCGLWGGVS